MSLLDLIKLAAAGSPGLHISQVYDIKTYKGDGIANRIISSEVDMSVSGGMVLSRRFDTASSPGHKLWRAPAEKIDLDSTGVFNTFTGVNEYATNGLRIGSGDIINASGIDYVLHIFKKFPQFFDIVQYAGTGGVRNINHNLGIAPGFMLIKCDSPTFPFVIYHKDLGPTKYTLLSVSSVVSDSSYWNDTAPTAAQFTVGAAPNTNASGGNIYAFLLAHNPTLGVFCGSFTTDIFGNAEITTGWEPQTMFFARSSGSPDSNRILTDTDLGWSYETNSKVFNVNLNDAQANVSLGYPTDKGFKVTNLTASSDYWFVAIKKNDKAQLDPSKVFHVSQDVRSGTANYEIAGLPFKPDVWVSSNLSDGSKTLVHMSKRFKQNTALAWHNAQTDAGLFPNGNYLFKASSVVITPSSAEINTGTNVNYFLRCSPGFFDELVFDKSDGVHFLTHNLKAVPEFILLKKAINLYSQIPYVEWGVYHKDISLPETKALSFLSSGVPQVLAVWNNTAPTAKQVTIAPVNGAGVGDTYSVWLFASLLGVCKVGSYVGNGTSQTIDCNFTAGARFILIKRIDAAGAWVVFDSVRGIVAGNDPYFLFNALPHITTEDAVDPTSVGFIVNQIANSNINISAATYVYLAIA